MNKVQDTPQMSSSSDIKEGGVSVDSEKRCEELKEFEPVRLEEDLTVNTKSRSEPLHLPKVCHSDAQDSSPTKKSRGPLSATSKGSKLSRKSTLIIEPAKEHKKSYVLAFLSSLSFGTANYFLSDLSIKHGLKGVPCQFIGFIAIWILFHSYKFAQHKLSKSKKPFFDRSSSPYFEEFIQDADLSISDNESISQMSQKSIYQLTANRVSAPFWRGLCQLAIQIAIIQCFEFAAKSGVNGGIISTIFSSSSLFSILIFYFKYGQQVTKMDFLGTFFILLCVVLIALGGAGGFTEGDEDITAEQRSQNNMYLVLALAFAILSGLVLSFNTVTIQYTIHTGFELDQANYDGGCMVGLLQAPFYFYFRKEYEPMDLLIASVGVIGVTLGVIFFSRSLACGIAGPVQAIENTKTIVTTLLGAIFLSQIPNLMQWFGLLSGLLGVIVIVIQKKENTAAKEIEIEL